MESRLIISQNKFLPAIVNALEEGKKLLQGFVSLVLTFQKKSGLQILDAPGNATMSVFLSQTSVIPFSDSRFLKFNVDQVRDAETFREWTLKKLYEVCDGRLGADGPRLTFQKFTESVETPDELILEVIVAKYNLEYWLHELPKEVDLIPYFEVTNDVVKVQSDAEEKLIDRHTNYASKAQGDFFNEVNKVLESLSTVEAKYHRPGLTLKGLVHSESGYKINPEILTDIK